MGLVTSVVLGAETPVDVGEDGFVFEIYCAKDTAAYLKFPFNYKKAISEKRSL